MGFSMSTRRRRAASSLGTLVVVASLGVATAGSAASQPITATDSQGPTAVTRVAKVDDSALTQSPAALTYVGYWNALTGANKYMNTEHRTAQATAKIGRAHV